jgi:hypothetical protein
MTEQLPDPDTLHSDGYRIIERDTCEDGTPIRQLFIELNAGDKKLASAQVYSRVLTPEGVAELSRASSLLHAICRFKNAGGRASELDMLFTIIDRLPDISVPLEVGQLIYSEERVDRWDYYCNDAGQYWRSRLDEFTEPVSNSVMVELVEDLGLPLQIDE